MALTVPQRPPVSPWPFVKLKLRLIAGGLRGRPARIVLFVLGVVMAGLFAIGGYALLAVPGVVGDERAAGMLLQLGGSLLVLGWVVLPLLFFGVDESLDPARFALLPLRRRTLILGMFVAALAGLPALSTLAATLGMVSTAAALGGSGAAFAELAGVVGGLLLCVALSRAVTSAFATALRSRRARDLAAVLLTLVAMLLGPAQIAVLNGASGTDWARLSGTVEAVGWTPLGAPYTLGLEAAAGRWWAVPLKLVIVGATIVALLAWWSKTLESAMLGAAGGQAANPGRRVAGPPVAQLLPRWLPAGRFGALVGREIRYWWREARRRAGLITFGVAAVVVPLTVTITNGETTRATTIGWMILVGVLGAINLANQFGYEGTAYAANIVAGVPGRVELHSRVVGLTVYVLPIMLVAATVIAVYAGHPAWIPGLLGMLLAAYGAGLAVSLPLSVLGAYAMPDTSNPFAISSGGGMAKSLYSFAAMLVGAVLCAPYLIAFLKVGDGLLWTALPVGAVYGGAVYALGAHLTGALLDRRMPELLQTVNPRR